MSSAFIKNLKKIEKLIADRSLLSSGDRVLIALSGGGDSVFLLHALNAIKEKYNITISAAHLNHKLRPEADSEQEFVKNLCACLGVDCFFKSIDIQAVSQDKGISLETAGRNSRYEFFGDLKKKYGFSKIATAHHSDDNAETILMHFIRGSGANGLKGIEAKRGDIIRPLLRLSKSEISQALEEQNYKYVTDSSNFKPIYLRNKIRLLLIPELLKLNPNFLNVITENARLFSEDEEFINEYTDKIFSDNYNNGGFPKETLDSLPISVRRRIIQRMYKEKTNRVQNLSNKYTDSVLAINKTGACVSLPKQISAYLSYGILKIEKSQNEEENFEYEIEIGRELFIPQTEEYWIVKKAQADGSKIFSLPDNTRLTVRNRRCGDRFYPIGMNGSKNLADFFTDKKIPRHKRNKIPILTSGEKIINISGIHRDRRFYCGEKHNLYVLEVHK